ncbi:DNA helicase [Tanacetum coccineum]
MVWVLVDLPPGCKIVGSKWIFKKKTDMDGIVHTYKACLVAKGYTQLYGVDYEETFSPASDIRSIRILIAIAAYYDYEIWKMDVKTAFLNGYLDEDIYMVQLEGFVDPNHPRKDDIISDLIGLSLLNGDAVDWNKLKQSTTAMSATEAEYIAASEAVWIRKFISGLGYRPRKNYLEIGVLIYEAVIKCDWEDAMLYVVKGPRKDYLEIGVPVYEAVIKCDWEDAIGYGPGCDVPSTGTPLASCSSRISGLYIDVFRKCFEFCSVNLQRECSTTFRVINRAEDAQLYLDVYRKYSRVSRKAPCVQQETDKRNMQQSGHSDIFESYLALCSSGAGSRRSRSVPQIPTDLNSNLVHTGYNSLRGSSVSLPGRSFHENPNAATITVASPNSYHVSRDVGSTLVNCQLCSRLVASPNSYPVLRDGGSTRVNCQLSSRLGVTNNASSASRRARNVQVRPRLISAASVAGTSRRTKHRVLTSASTIDNTSVAGEPHMAIAILEIVIGAIVSMALLFAFRMARDKCKELDIPEFKIRLYNAEGARSYELPTSNTLGAMVFESGIADNADFDVIIQHTNGPAQRVNKLHPLYMSLQFPLLFIYGQPGYQLHFRLQQYDLLFRGGRLFQQCVVGVFCAVEQNRLDFIRKKQNDIRSDYLSGLYDAIS